MMGQEGDDYKDMRDLYSERKMQGAPKPLPGKKKPKNRPLTPGEIAIWTRKTGGIKPNSSATLMHFRRGMAGGGWKSQD
jgi:hypothetical protein